MTNHNNEPSSSVSRRNVLKYAGAVTAGLAGAGMGSFLSGGGQVAYAAASALQVFDVKTYGAIGNGSANDAPAIQNAINDASNATNKGGIVWFPAGVYKLGSGLTISDQVTLAGTGWETPLFNTSTTPPNTMGNGSWLYVDSTAFIPVTVNGQGTMIRDLAIAHLQPNPTSSSWTPTNYPFAIDIKTNDVWLENIFLRNPTRGIRIFNSTAVAVGRVILNRVWGQPFLVGIYMDNVLDTIKVHDIHFWPFWNWSTNLQTYQRVNAYAFQSFRNDGPIFSDIFVFGCNVGFYFAASASGVTQKFQITNANLDFCKYGIQLYANDATGQISNLVTQGSPGIHGVHVVAANARLQCTNIRPSDIDKNGIRVEGSGAIVFLENVWVDRWNNSGLGFPAIEAVSPATIYVGRGRLFEIGNGAANTGGSGTIILDN
jgi:hypothetical protein